MECILFDLVVNTLHHLPAFVKRQSIICYYIFILNFSGLNTSSKPLNPRLINKQCALYTGYF